MVNISLILAACFCGIAPLATNIGSQNKVESVSVSLIMGKEIVSDVRNGYEAGEYNEFLTEMDQSYKEADLAQLIEMRQKNVPEDFQKKWEEDFLALQKKRNHELKAAISDKENSLIAEKVRFFTGQIVTPEQEKALSKLNSFIAMAPGQGTNEDENTLIAIDLEYEYKLLHAKSQDEQDLQKKGLALRMEKMDKMVEASKNFKDASLKGAVGIASATLDARLAKNLDGVDLNSLAKNEKHLQDPSASKIIEIMQSYQSQFSDLMKRASASNQG